MSRVLLALVAAGAMATDYSDEIRNRLKWWETHHPEYVQAPDDGPVYPSVSTTVRYAADRTGIGDDPLAAEFLARGYFLLDALYEKRDMAPLSRREIADYVEALRLTRIEFVDEPQWDNEGKQVVSVVIPDPAQARYKLIRVYRKDWTESQRLGVDLVRLVFHEYLRVIGKPDDNYVVSVRLTVTERDFQKRPPVTPSCLSGHWKHVHIAFNISYGYYALRGTAYVNGQAFDPSDSTSFRTFNSSPLCTAKAFAFELALGGFRRTLYLYGGDNVTVLVPSGREIFDR